MNTIQNIAKNVSVLGISSIATSLLGFFLLIYIARYLGEVEYGKYCFALSFTALFMIFSNIGINNLIIREIARNKEQISEYLTNVLLIRFLLSFLAFGLVVISINLLNYPRDITYAVYFFGIYNILSWLELTFRSIFQAFEKLEYDAIVLIVGKIILLILSLFAIYQDFDLIKLAYVFILSSALSLTLSAVLLLIKIAVPKPKIDFTLWKVLLIGSIPFSINILFSVLFFQIDTVMLSILKDNTSVGIYSAAYNPLLALGVIPSVFIAAIYPVMSRFFVSSKNSLDILAELASKYMAIIGFPASIICFVLADQFIELFYADQFSASIASFQILAFFIPLRWVSVVTGTFLTSINKQGYRTLCIGVSAFLNIILNAVMIPRLGYIGASIATVLSEVFLYFIIIYFINKDYRVLKLHRHFTKPIVASLVMGVFIFHFHSVGLIFIIPLAGIVYLSILLLMHTFSEDDKDILKQLIAKG